MKINLKKQLRAALSLLVAPVIVCGVMAAPAFAATDLSIDSGAKAAKGDDQQSCLVNTDKSACGDDQTPLFQTITNVLLFIIGAVSVIMLIIGGFRYTVSQGDSSALTSAKNTILYSIIGIIVALLAYALVNFVIAQFVAS